jgi:hypothetical protein
MKSRAIALAVCGAALSACTGIPSMPSFNLPSISAPSLPGFTSAGAPVRVESTPPGAEASIGGGTPCKTPCTLSAPFKSGTYNVTVTLNGYQSQTIPVHVAIAQDTSRDSDAGVSSASTTVIEPDPVVAALEPAGKAAAPAARQKPPAASVKPAKKPAAPAAPPTASAPPAPTAPPMPTPSGFGPPPAQQPGVFR